MVQYRTSNLALLSMEYEEAQHLDMNILIDKFAKAKVRRGLHNYNFQFFNLILYTN